MLLFCVNYARDFLVFQLQTSSGLDIYYLSFFKLLVPPPFLHHRAILQILVLGESTNITGLIVVCSDDWESQIGLTLAVTLTQPP